MQKKRITIISTVLGTLVVLLLVYVLCHRSYSPKVTISEVADIEAFLTGQNIELTYTDDIQYVMLNDTSVLVVDDRNAGCREYTHSTVRGDLDADGVLKVMVKDEMAASEADISGRYAVVIEAKDRINRVVIEFGEAF